MTTITPATTDQDVPMKQCYGCHQWFPLDTFGKHPKTTDGRLGKCPKCMSEAHAEPFRKLKELAEKGEYVPSSYGGRHFQQHMLEKMQAKKPQKSVTVRLGYGIITQEKHRPVEQPEPSINEQLAALNAVETPEPAAAVPEPAVATPALIEKRMSLEFWMTEPDAHPRGELFQFGALLIRRYQNTYTLYALDGSAPANEVPGDVLLWAVRAATQTPLDQEMLGLRYY